MPTSLLPRRTGRTGSARRRARRRRPAETGPLPSRVGGRVVVIGATVGQGHEGAAKELARRLTASGAQVERYDYLDALPAPVARALRDLYAPAVRYTPSLFDGLFRSLEEREGRLRRITEWICRLAQDKVARWAAEADVVVSTYPLAGRTLGELRREGRMPAATVSYLTDPAAHALWCHPLVDVHLTVTAATAVDAARYGVRARVAGPLCAPGFGAPGLAEARPADRAACAVRAELGVPAGVPFVLLSAGSLGMGDITATVEDVTRHPTAVAVVLCGRNEALRRKLADRERVVALGWRTDVPDLMAAADVLVHNAGGLSFTEALVAGLPALTYLPIPGHGSANAAVLERAGIAAWPRTADELADGIGRIHRTRPRPGSPWPTGADPAAVVEQVLRSRPSARFAADAS